MRYKKINNMKELQEEKGVYYPYIMQEMGASVINGVLIPETSLKYMYSNHIEGIFQIILDIYITNLDDEKDYSNKLFPKVSKSEFIHSMVWAISDLFYDGCDVEDLDEDKCFSFFNREESYKKDTDGDFNWTGRRLKYGDRLID